MTNPTTIWFRDSLQPAKSEAAKLRANLLRVSAFITETQSQLSTVRGLEARRDQLIAALQSNLFVRKEEADEAIAELAEIYNELEKL